MGEEAGQLIEVIKRDESGSPVTELREEMEPGTARELRLMGKGNITIEVRHNGKVIKHAPFSPGETLSD